MTQSEYLDYLRIISEFDFDKDLDDIDMRDQLYGAFQCFMPEGKGVEQIFSPFNNKEELIKRIRPIYKLTEESVKSAMNEGLMPGYFNSSLVQLSENELESLGQSFISNMRQFAEYLNDIEFVELLSKVQEVKVLSDRKSFDKKRDETTDWVYDVVSDWAIENIDEASLIEILGEAYYSISCDYWLAYYFQYPSFESKPTCDLFKPYFDLWSKGYICAFCDEGLIISPC